MKLEVKLGLKMNSMNERMDDDEVCAFTNVPTTKKAMQLICLVSKQLTMMNIPLPKIQHDRNLSVITPNDPVKNTLILGVKVMLIRVRHLDEDISKSNDNVVSDGRGLHLDVKIN